MINQINSLIILASVSATSGAPGEGASAAKKLSYAESLFWGTEPIDKIMSDASLLPAERQKKLEEAEARLTEAVKYFEMVLANVNSLKPLKRTEAYGEAGTANIVLAVAMEALGRNSNEVIRTYGIGIQYLLEAENRVNNGKADAYNINTRLQQIYYNIAWVSHRKLNNPGMAEKYYGLAIAHMEAHGVQKFVDAAGTYLGLGEILEEKGNTTEAEKNFNKALEIGLKPDQFNRLGEIYAIRILKEPPSPERSKKLEVLINKYFLESKTPKAKMWIARIYGIIAEDDVSLRKTVSFVDANMEYFLPEDRAEARLIRAEAGMRLELMTVKPEDWKFERPLADINAVINDPTARDDLKGKAYLLKAKILTAMNDTTNARIALNEAEKLLGSIEPSLVNDVKKLDTINSGVNTLRKAEEARIKQDYKEAVKLYLQARDAFLSVDSPDPTEVNYYLGQTYFGLAEVYRYGKGTQDVAKAKENYGLAIERLSKQSDPFSHYMTAMSHIGLAYIAFSEKNLAEVENQYNLARAVFDEVAKDHPDFDLLPELEVRILKLHGELLSAQGKPEEARKEFAAAREAQKQMPAGPVATSLVEEINRSDRGQSASDVPPIIDVRQVDRRGTQNTRGSEVDQNFSGPEISVNVPIGKSKKSNFSIGLFYSDLKFESTVNGKFDQYIATYDADGNPVYKSTPDDSIPLPILEGESMQRIRLSGSYYRDFGKWNMWATGGIERIKISAKMLEYTWPGTSYTDNFHNPTPNETSFDHTANVLDLRGHANWLAYDTERFRVAPNFEFFVSAASPNESSAFHTLTKNYIAFLQSQSGSTQPDIVDARKGLDDLKAGLKIENLVSWYIQPGVNFTIKEPEIGGSTRIGLFYRYGLPLADESLYGFWPRNESMETARSSINFNLYQQVRRGNFEGSVLGIYNQDIASGAFEGGNYWVVEAAAGYHIPRTRVYPELYYSQSAGKSADYSQTTNVVGLRLKLLDF